MTSGPFMTYHSAIEEFFNGTQDWDTDAHYVVLLLGSYTPDLNHTTFADLSAYECLDADYNPQNLIGETVTRSGAVTTMDASDVTFGNSVTITAAYLAICLGDVAGKTGADRLVGYMLLDDTPANIVTSAQPLIIQWDSVNGIFDTTGCDPDTGDTLGAIVVGNMTSGTNVSPLVNFSTIQSIPVTKSGTTGGVGVPTQDDDYDYTAPYDGITVSGWT